MKYKSFDFLSEVEPSSKCQPGDTRSGSTIVVGDDDDDNELT